MHDGAYNVLILAGQVAFTYRLTCDVDKAWGAYVDTYLRNSKDKSTTVGVRR